MGKRFMQKHEESIWYAQDDLTAAKILCRENIYRASLYHCQQAAEKALKAYLVWKNATIRKTHDLIILTDICTQFDEQFLSLYEICFILKPFSTQTRYPDDFSDPELEAVERAIECAHTILKFVEERLP